MGKPRTKKAVITSLRRPSHDPARKQPPTKGQIRQARAEGAVWVPKKVAGRIVYIKTTTAREKTARDIKASRVNDFLLGDVGRQTKDAGKVVASGANLSPWLYGGLPGRHRRVFGTPEGKKFVSELKKRVKANAMKGKMTRLLDIGAGLAQHWIPVLRELRKHGEVELEVLNPSRVGKEHSPATQWRVGAIETHDFGRRQYDGVLCTYGGFDKSNYPIETLQKMAKLMRKGGVQYLIFGRKELGEGVPMTRAQMKTALRKADPNIKITVWAEPSGPLKHSKKAYRKDLIFVRPPA